MNFIANLLLAKKFTCGGELTLRSFLFLIISLFLSGCVESQKEETSSRTFSLSQEEKMWLKEFFRDLLFKTPGAYTLFGTKPISTSCIYLLTEEDKQKMDDYYWTLPEEERSKLRRRRYDYDKNYEKWKQIKDRFPIRQYLFGSFLLPMDDKVELVIFVNIEETLRTLLKYYGDFRRVLGRDFDPLQVVFEVEDRSSEFWNAVIRHHSLQGILLGFGRDNAWFFEWDLKYERERNQIGEFLASLPMTPVGDEEIENYGPHNFSLPIFTSYGLYPDKALIEGYKKERERIRSLYKGRDEVDVALNWLTR
jgi:hypothetical protein